MTAIVHTYPDVRLRWNSLRDSLMSGLAQWNSYENTANGYI